MYIINKVRPKCDANLTMKYIGGKWKALILFQLIEKKRYNELKRSCVNITERALSLQLKNLEEDGLVKRTVHTLKPPLKVEYELTDFGKTLIPLLKAIAKWGTKTAKKNKKIKVE